MSHPPLRTARLAGLAVLFAGFGLAGCSMMAGEESAPPPMTKPVQVAMPAPPPPPPPPAPPPEPVKIEPAPPPPRFAGHVASYRTRADAEKAWPILVKDKPIAGGLPPRFVEVDLGGQRGKTLRVLLGAFPDREATREFCREIRKEGLYCAPQPLP